MVFLTIFRDDSGMTSVHFFLDPYPETRPAVRRNLPPHRHSVIAADNLLG
jgi:hypothetical protein